MFDKSVFDKTVPLGDRIFHLIVGTAMIGGFIFMFISDARLFIEMANFKVNGVEADATILSMTKSVRSGRRSSGNRRYYYEVKIHDEFAILKTEHEQVIGDEVSILMLNSDTQKITLGESTSGVLELASLSGEEGAFGLLLTFFCLLPILTFWGVIFIIGYLLPETPESIRIYEQLGSSSVKQVGYLPLDALVRNKDFVQNPAQIGGPPTGKPKREGKEGKSKKHKK